MKKRKSLNWLCGIFCSLAMLLALTVPASAYVTCGYKLTGSWANDHYYLSARSVTYNNKTVNYGNITDAAINEWNEAVDATRTSNLDIELTETNDGDASTTRVVVDALDRGATGWRGFTYYYKYNALTGNWSSVNYGGYPNTNYTAGSAVINIYVVHSNAQWKIQNTIMHEMGHIFGLKHSDKVGALMVDGTSVYTELTPPQSDDVAGVRAIYG